MDIVAFGFSEVSPLYSAARSSWNIFACLLQDIDLGFRRWDILLDNAACVLMLQDVDLGFRHWDILLDNAACVLIFQPIRCYTDGCYNYFWVLLQQQVYRKKTAWIEESPAKAGSHTSCLNI